MHRRNYPKVSRRSRIPVAVADEGISYDLVVAPCVLAWMRSATCRVGGSDAAICHISSDPTVMDLGEETTRARRRGSKN